MAGQRINWAIMLATAAMLTGCGSSSSSTPKQIAATSQRSLSLHVNPPSYSGHGPHTTLTGSVTPGAQVYVYGDSAKVQGGHWSRTINVEVGTNNVEVTAVLVGAFRPRETQSVTLTRQQTGAERAAERAAERSAEAARKAAEAAHRAAEAAHRAAEAEHRAAVAAAEERQYKERAVSIPYAQLNKNADAYKGKIVHYEGQIFQIQEETGGGGYMLLSVTNNEGFWTDHIYVNYTGHVKGTEKSIVNIYGEVTGTKSYKTQIGGETYVPEVQAKYVIG